LWAGFVVKRGVGAAGELLAGADAEGVAIGETERCGHGDNYASRCAKERRMTDDRGRSVPWA